jgi:hypothetical protein
VHERLGDGLARNRKKNHFIVLQGFTDRVKLKASGTHAFTQTNIKADMQNKRDQLEFDTDHHYLLLDVSTLVTPGDMQFVHDRRSKTFNYIGKVYARVRVARDPNTWLVAHLTGPVIKTKNDAICT